MTFRCSLQITPVSPDTPLEVHRMCSTRLNYARFRQILARSEPLVVTSVQHVMQGKWTLAYFVQCYGSEVVTITNCKSDHEHSSTVAQFFSSFGSLISQTNHQVLKLKALPLSLLHCPGLTRPVHRIGRRRATSRTSFPSYMRRLSTAYCFLITHALMACSISSPTSPQMVSSLILVGGCVNAIETS
jgi:hypothetical protein